jgi:hypothetical protein
LPLLGLQANGGNRPGHLASGLCDTDFIGNISTFNRIYSTVKNCSFLWE